MTTYTGKIEQSPNDKRTYRLVTLDNQLQVLLVSDPETEKSAACCDVNVGSLSDPKEALGLAHFLEHMLFMGTEKYPQENAYSAYLSNHGGSSNAYTDDENTVYYFDVLNNHFEGALDLFASFFTCPLFSESGVMREINAVDSENSKNLQSDPWRKYQLFKNLAREDHPLHTFSTGNLHTLHEIPQSKGTNIRQLMIDFYEKYYSANLMKVSIYGKESLDVLQQWAVEKFSAVPNKNNPLSHFPSDPFRTQDTRKIVEFVPVRDLKNLEIIFPFPPMEHLYRSKPDRYLSHLIGHESEGSILSALKQKSLANGLSSYLFQSSRDFACFAVNIELSNEGVEQVESIIQCVFTYIGMLKTQGVQDWVAQEIIETSQMKFNFLDKKEPADYVIRLANAMHYYEPSHTLSGNYLYYEKDLKTVEELIKLLTPENAVIMFSHKGLEGKTSLVEQWYSTKYNVKDFTPEQLATWKKEIEASESAWKDLLHLPKPNPFIPTDFTLYTVENKGETFPTLFSKEGKSVIEVPETPVVAEEEKKDAAETSAPMEVADGKDGEEEGDEEEGDEEEDGEDEDEEDEQPSSGGSGAEPDIRSNILGVSNIIWKMEDSHWKVPKLNVIISLENQFATLGPWNIAMTDLLLSILKELLNEYSYYADCSGLYYYLRLNRGGIDMIFRGYHHKLPILIERVCKELKSLSEGENIELYKVLFERMKEKQLRNYKNTFYAQPYSHCILGSLLCLEEPRYTNQEKYLALQNITSIHEFLTFVKVFINQLKLEIFINGNFNINHVYKDIIEEKIVSILKCSSLPFGQQLSRRGVDIWQYSQSSGVKDFIYRQSAHHYNPNEVNSAIENVYMVGTLATVHDYNKEVKGNLPSFERDTIVKEALVQLFEQMMSEEAFDQLRTKEQLGYIVFTGMKRLAQNVAALHIIVQSHHKDPLYLNDRIENFLARYYEEVLKPMTEEKFHHFVHAVKEKLIEKPKNLDEETDRHWDEISNQTYLFNRNHLMVEKFDQPALITKEVAVEFFEKYLLASSSHRIKFSSQFFGGKTSFPSSNNVDPTKVMIIQDPNLFKRKLPLLSVLTADQF